MTNEKLFEHTLKGIVEAADRFGKVKADHDRWIEINKMTVEDRPTLIYYVQTVLNTFKRREEEGYHTKDRQYAIELLEKAMECQHDIWNDAIEEAANKVESAGNILLAHSVRELKK